MKLTKAQRQTIYEMFDGHCAYCGCMLPEKGWHADHVEPIMRDSKWVNGEYTNGVYKYGRLVPTGTCSFPENERIDNLFPACHRCNIEKSCDSIEGFRRGLERKIEVLRRNSSPFRHAERYGLVVVAKEKVVFYFETFSRKEIA